MNLLTKLADSEQTATPTRGSGISRRNLLKTTAAALATPAAVALSANQAYAADSTVVDVLNFALLLEYLEADFYAQANSMSSLIPASDKDLFKKIGDHEMEHVELLKSVLGSAAIAKPVFDFTAGGKFPTVFSNYDTFLVLSQSFEDLGVRAYKGQAPRLKTSGNKDILLSALKIHSVEARHAGEVRLLRGLRVWTSEQETGGAPAAIYEGEYKFLPGISIDVIQLSTPKFIQRDGGALYEKIPRESFDEPLSKEQVMAIAMPFVMSVAP